MRLKQKNINEFTTKLQQTKEPNIPTYVEKYRDYEMILEIECFSML